MCDVVVAVVGLFARAHGLVYGKLVHSSTRNVNHDAINRMQFLCATCFCPVTDGGLELSGRGATASCSEVTEFSC